MSCRSVDIKQLNAVVFVVVNVLITLAGRAFCGQCSMGCITMKSLDISLYNQITYNQCCIQAVHISAVILVY